jgi:hypothetical protein
MVVAYLSGRNYTSEKGQERHLYCLGFFGFFGSTGV